LVDSEENLYVLSIGGSSKLHIFNKIGEQKIVDFTFLSENGFLSLGGQNDLYIPGRENLYVVKPSVGDRPLIEGCIDSEALNYNPEAEIDDGSCQYEVEGCTNPDAENYDPEATIDNGSCILLEIEAGGTMSLEDVKLKGDISASSTATSTPELKIESSSSTPDIILKEETASSTEESLPSSTIELSLPKVEDLGKEENKIISPSSTEIRKED